MALKSVDPAQPEKWTMDMLKIDNATLDEMESQRAGIKAQILSYDSKELPGCPRCGTGDTAKVIFGIIGRTIDIAVATTKVHLQPNAPGSGTYFCYKCGKYFG